MAELKTDLLKISKRLCYSFFILMFFVIGFQLGTMYYQHHIETGDTFSQWLSHSKNCTTNKMDLSNNDVLNIYNAEYTCDERISDYKIIIWLIRIEVIIIFLMSLIDYFIDKEEHWATKISGWLKSISLE